MSRKTAADNTFKKSKFVWLIITVFVSAFCNSTRTNGKFHLQKNCLPKKALSLLVLLIRFLNCLSVVQILSAEFSAVKFCQRSSTHIANFQSPEAAFPVL